MPRREVIQGNLLQNVVNASVNGVGSSSYVSAVNQLNNFQNTVGPTIIPGDHTITIHSVNPSAGTIVYSCANGSNRTRSLSPAPVTPPVPVSPPPPPTKTCSYISSWSVGSWSQCNLNTNWTSGKNNCTQSRSVSPNYGSTTVYVSSSCPGDSPRPESSKQINLSLSYDKGNSTCNNISKYANNNEECSINFNVIGYPSEGIAGWGSSSITSVNYYKIAYVDQISQSGQNGNEFSRVIVNGNSISINFKSVVPFILEGKLSFSLKGQNGFTNQEFNNIKIGFLKPYIGKLSIEDDEVKVGFENNIDLIVSNMLGLNVQYTIQNYKSSMKTNNPLYVIQKIGNETNLNSNPKIDLRINYQGKDTIGQFELLNSPVIKYTLGGKNIVYRLSGTKEPNDNKELILKSKEFDNVKIVGLSQLEGKSYISGQGKNYSSLYKPEIRSKVIQDVETKSRGGNSQIMILKNDAKISELKIDKISTIYLENGNLTIDQNIENQIGIVVLKTNQSDQNNGNIYVTPNVSVIKAFIYTDGGLVSMYNGSKKISDYVDSTNRTQLLNKQLVIKGALYSYNTIGGAIKGDDGKYILPKGVTTDNFDLSMVFDLNFFRSGNIGWNNNNSQHNQGYNNNLVIISEKVNNTIPGFSN
ncbi:MAG: hypothetical protein V3575_03010 [Candidatus Absconditabacteria bacterium]